MGTYDEYGTDKQKEENGVWVEMLDGSKWLLARGNSIRSRKALNNARKPFRQHIQRSERMNADLPEDISDKINLEWASTGLVLNWEGVTGKDGNALPFSKENVKTILNDLPDLFEEVVRVVSSSGNFTAQLNEEAEKNS